MRKESERPERLLITLDEFARATGLSPKTIWNYTQPRGPIPCVRLGRSVRYAPDAALESLMAVQQRATAAL
jgi:predicted DNA-binding transcriptional regulator AlpA